MFRSGFIHFQGVSAFNLNNGLFMEERFEYNLYPYWMMLTHVFNVVFTAIVFMLSVIVAFAFAFSGRLGDEITNAEGKRILALLLVMVSLTVVTKIIERVLKERIETGPKKRLTLDTDFFVYRDETSNEYVIYWNDVTSINIKTMKMGFQLSVSTDNMKFSLCSYEVDPLPILFKEQLSRARDEVFRSRNLKREYQKKLFDRNAYRLKQREIIKLNLQSKSANFFTILKRFKEKSLNAEIKKDFYAKSLSQQIDLF